MPTSPRPDDIDEIDPLDQAFTAEDLARFPAVARCRTVRWKLGLTKAEFSDRYRIPPETIDAWEAGTAEPDAAARAYLEVIAAEPEATARALMGVHAA